MEIKPNTDEFYISEGLRVVVEKKDYTMEDVVKHCLGRYHDTAIVPEIQDRIGFTVKQMPAYYVKERVSYIRKQVVLLNPERLSYKLKNEVKE